MTSNDRPIVSYMPMITWRETNKKAWRGDIRDSNPSEMFAIGLHGPDDYRLFIYRLDDVCAPWVPLGDFLNLYEAQRAAQAHLDKGPTRDERTPKK